MRVIAGQAKGRALRSPPGMVTRPTSGRLREAVFNMLQNIIPGCHFLDLFAGSGAMGIEALSRGAATVVMVESERRALQTLRANLEQVGLVGGRVLASRVPAALSLLAREGTTFDIVYLDPPYYRGLAATTLRKLAALPLVRAEGVVLVEVGRDENLLPPPGLLEFQRRDYGSTSLLCYRPQPVYS